MRAQGGPVNRVEQIGVNGSALVNGSAIDLGDASQSADSGLNATSSGFAADTARNTFFVAVDQATTGTTTSVIETGSINKPGSLTTLFTDLFPNFEAFVATPPNSRRSVASRSMLSTASFTSRRTHRRHRH